MEATDAGDRISTTATAPPAPRHDALLGKYELGRLLGRGTFAKVYYARSVADGAAVAIKVIDKSGVPASMQARVLREVSIMSRLRHPHIVQLHEVMATRTKIYLVMEHAGGGELLSLVARRGRVPEPAAWKYLRQLVAALRFCHARGVAHRDVKPQNLLLDARGDLKVSDFGLSALPEQLRDDGLLHTACGTPAFTAPEVMRRKGYDGARADAWSCGVILYVMLAGRLPFDDANLALMWRKVQKRDYEVPPWFSSSARRLVSRLLDPNPETRLTLDALAELPWLGKFNTTGGTSGGGLRRSASSPAVPAASGGGGGEYGPCTAANAFDLISLSSGLDLSGFFRGEGRRAEKRSFTSASTAESVLGRVEAAGEEMGYRVERRKGASLLMSKEDGQVLSAEAMEVAPALLLVEMELEAAGVKSGQPEDLSWTGLRRGLGDAVLDWVGAAE